MSEKVEKTVITKTIPKQTNQKKQKKQKARKTVRTQRSRAPAAQGSRFRQLKAYVRNGMLHATEIFQVPSCSYGYNLMIPFCPTKWTGTRSATELGLYGDYRPTRCSITWNPSCGTNTNGTVAVGTVWSGNRTDWDSHDFAQRMLCASNGGFMTSTWQSCGSNVKLGSNLRANNFPTTEIQADDVPFWILVDVQSTETVSLGYISISYAARVHNPQQVLAKPLSLSGTITLTHNDSDPHTTLEIPASSDMGLSTGTDIQFVFNNALKNVAGAVVTHVLEPVRASFVSYLNGKLRFIIDSAFGSQHCFGQILGRMANSF